MLMTVILANIEEENKNILKALQLHCEQWKLQVNNSKTKVVVYSRGKRNCGTYNFVYREGNIETIQVQVPCNFI